MTTMLEKAAMAAAGCTEQEWLGDHEQYRNAWRGNARAALQAIREPDEIAARAGWEGVKLLSPTATFTAMVDAILAEDKG